MPALLEYSAHDLCQTIFLELNSDGSIASEEDAYVLSGPTAAIDTTVTVGAPVAAETPDFGVIILDPDATDTGPIVLNYESVVRATGVFQLSGAGTVGAIVADAEDVTVRRSEPIVHCAVTQVRLVPQVTGEVVDEDPGGQANQNVARRRIPPQASGYLLEADLSSRENAALWALLDQYAPVLDPAAPDEYIGFEEIVTTASSCPTCGGGAGVGHSVAAILIYNAWCGEERHPTIPYVAKVLRSLTFEPSTVNLVRGRGFQTRSMAATMTQNTLFDDPWGIDPRGAGVTAKWSELAIKQTTIDGNADLANLLANGCGCGACPNPSLAFPSVAV